MKPQQLFVILFASSFAASASAQSSDADFARQVQDASAAMTGYVEKLPVHDGYDLDRLRGWLARGAMDTPLLLSIVGVPFKRPNDVEAAELLMEHGADINARTGLGGLTPLMHAAQQGRADMVKAMLKTARTLFVKVDVDAQDDGHGFTALMHAARVLNNRPDTGKEIAAALLDKGAEVNKRDRRGRTVLHLVAQGDADIGAIAYSDEAYQFLVGRGAQEDLKDDRGQTPAELRSRTRAWAGPVRNPGDY